MKSGTRMFLFLALVSTVSFYLASIRFDGLTISQHFKSIAMEYGWINKPPLISNQISTSRYEFLDTNTQFPNGKFQLEKIENRLLLIERNTLELFEKQLGEDHNQKFPISLGRIFIKDYQRDFKLSDEDFIHSDTPLVMDLAAYANKGFISVVVRPIDKNCLEMRLYTFPIAELTKTELIYRTACVPNLTNAIMFGGRIALDKQFIYLSIGDQLHDRSGFPIKITQDWNYEKKRDFGSILRFQKSNMNKVILSSGHRNIQGLWLNQIKSHVVATEHGPFGGDELNCIDLPNKSTIQSKEIRPNYGWPFVTLGKPYPYQFPSGIPEQGNSENPSSGVDKKLAKYGYKSGTHLGYVPPVLSWTPGLGIGQIIQINDSSVFNDWQGDFLFSAMAEKSLYRIRAFEITNRTCEQMKIYFQEKIFVGVRVRDFLIYDDSIIFSSDEGKVFQFAIKK